MVKDFYKDLRQTHKAEQLVRDVLAANNLFCCFTVVADEPQYYHIGDIKAFDISGSTRFIEVKQDSRIAQTGNVLCEEQVYYDETGRTEKGNMYYDYDIYSIVSEQERKIYFIDFSWLKRNYKRGKYKVIPHSDQTTYCYLLPLTTVKANGALMGVLEY